MLKNLEDTPPSTLICVFYIFFNFSEYSTFRTFRASGELRESLEKVLSPDFTVRHQKAASSLSFSEFGVPKLSRTALGAFPEPCIH